MFHDSQNNEYLNTVLTRLEDEVPLVWTSQFCSIINEFNSRYNLINSVNDIGCQVGQFYKSLLYHGLGDIDYRGYDIDDRYLLSFGERYPEKNKDLRVLDVSLKVPSMADACVMSATLEHIKDSENALVNILKSTKKVAIFRTFLGDSFEDSHVWKEGAKNYYQIQQFTWSSVIDLCLSCGFTVKILKDEYTGSVPVVINRDYRNNSPVIRTQYVIVAEKIYK